MSDLEILLTKIVGAASLFAKYKNATTVPYIALEGQAVENYIAEVEALVERRELEARRDELSNVQLEHGRYMTQTFINGQAMTVEERIAVIEGRLAGGLASPGTPTAGGNQVGKLSKEANP